MNDVLLKGLEDVTMSVAFTEMLIAVFVVNSPTGTGLLTAHVLSVKLCCPASLLDDGNMLGRQKVFINNGSTCDVMIYNINVQGTSSRRHLYLASLQSNQQ